MSLLELLSLIYSSPLQGHLINRTSRQRLSKCLIRTINLYFRTQKIYSDLSKTTNTHIASLHFLTSGNVHGVHICDTALFTSLLLSWTPPTGLLLEILVFCDFCFEYHCVLFVFKWSLFVSTSLCVSKYIYQNFNNFNKFPITWIPISGESLVYLCSHVHHPQPVKKLSQSGICSFRHSVILKHCCAAERTSHFSVSTLYILQESRQQMCESRGTV